jgi:hypothetical protein
MRPSRSRRASLILLAASTLFCAGLLLAGEWLVRALAPSRLRLSPARSAIVHSSRYGWQLRSGWRFRDEDGRRISTDSARRRVPVRAMEDAATTRVAVLGDSVAFGAGVDDHETFANRLAAREGWTVANFAVPGWGTDQSLLRYQHETRAWRPQVVVLSVCLANDLADNMLPNYLYDPSWPKPYFTLEGGTLRPHAEHLVRSRAGRAWRWAWESSHLLNLLALPRAEGGREPTHWMGRRRVAVKDEEAATRLTVQELAWLQQATQQDGVALLIALHPDRAAFEERSVLATRLAEEMAAAGVPALDLGARYRAAGWAFADLTLDGLGHLSPRGHAVAAELIGEAIRSRPLPAPGTR